MEVLCQQFHCMAEVHDEVSTTFMCPQMPVHVHVHTHTCTHSGVDYISIITGCTEKSKEDADISNDDESGVKNDCV